MVLNIKDIDAAPHILVVDDDQRLRDLLLRYLNNQGCLVVTAENAEKAEALLQRLHVDIVILDVMMPGDDGVTLTKRLKPEYPNLPILMLTARGETEFRIEGLEAGVDDYLSKPFDPKELWLRVQAILKRSGFGKNQVKENKIGEYSFDKDKRLLRSEGGETIALTESEVALLDLLISSGGEILDRYTLSDKLGLDANERTIDVQITRLRKKIEPDPKTPVFLQTVRGKGYVLKVG